MVIFPNPYGKQCFFLKKKWQISSLLRDKNKIYSGLFDVARSVKDKVDDEARGQTVVGVLSAGKKVVIHFLEGTSCEN